jgi:hypothetical protein
MEDLRELWFNLECLDAPLNTALRLHCRHVTSALVEPHIKLAKNAVQQVEEFLTTERGQDDDDDDGRPQDHESWSRWLQGRKKRIDVKKVLPQIRMAIAIDVDLSIYFPNHLATSPIIN